MPVPCPSSLYTHEGEYYGPDAIEIPFTCNGSGAYHVLLDRARLGYVHKIILGSSTIASSLTLQVDIGDGTILHKTSVSANGVWYPRVPENKASDGSALTTYTRQFATAPLELTISSGTAGDTGTVTVVLLPS
jgi:hypothetical protein